jgi:hypothetical protein
MTLESWRRGRRFSSAAVSLCAIALVMAKTRGALAEPGSDGPGFVAAIGFMLSLVVFIVSWRGEHRANEQAAALRERQQLELFKTQLALAKQKPK